MPALLRVACHVRFDRVFILRDSDASRQFSGRFRHACNTYQEKVLFFLQTPPFPVCQRKLPLKPPVCHLPDAGKTVQKCRFVFQNKKDNLAFRQQAR